MNEVDDSLQSQNVLEFLTEIEDIRRRDKVEYMDAIVHFCEKNDIEIEVMASFIRKNVLLKSKIQEEAEALNILPKSSRLPL